MASLIKNAFGFKKDPSLTSTTSNPSEKEEESQPPSDSEHVTGLRLYLIAASLALCIFLPGLDGTIVSTAIPAVTNEFHSLNDIGWVRPRHL